MHITITRLPHCTGSQWRKVIKWLTQYMPKSYTKSLFWLRWSPPLFYRGSTIISYTFKSINAQQGKTEKAIVTDDAAFVKLFQCNLDILQYHFQTKFNNNELELKYNSKLIIKIKLHG
jgi:hypothetical protein